MEFKRSRGINFSPQEAKMLIQCVLDEIAIVENKQVDNVTLRDKRSAWSRITERFNKEIGCNNRSVESLKVRYDNFKKKLKKRIRDHMLGMTLSEKPSTGKLNLEDYERDLISHLPLGIKVVALSTDGDSDNAIFDEYTSDHDPKNNEVDDTRTSAENALKIELDDEEIRQPAPSPVTINQAKENNLNNCVKSLSLGDAKRDLLKLQVQLAQEELARKRCEIAHLKEEQKLKLQILAIELSHKTLIAEEYQKECARKERLHQLTLNEYKLKLDLLNIELTKG